MWLTQTLSTVDCSKEKSLTKVGISMPSLSRVVVSEDKNLVTLSIFSRRLRCSLSLGFIVWNNLSSSYVSEFKNKKYRTF